MSDNLSFSRFRAYFDVKKELDFPSYTGSAIRGALGHAMREVRYGQKPAVCPDCPA